MEAKKIYKQLEKDFISPELHDDWFQYMESVKDFVSDNFKKRSMGLVCDNSEEIKKVYTAVFPTDEVMQNILDKNEKDVLLFVHHPSIWDISKAPDVYQQMNPKMLKQFKEKRISIYNLHVPLDNYGKYSTSVSLARALGIKPEKSFAPYRGGLAGVIGKNDCKTTKELKEKFQYIIGHEVILYSYGTSDIKNEKVAVVAGGGNDIEILKEVSKEKINTFVTGITILNDHSQKAHDFAKQNGINILGGTHYSTERFACQSICDYFEKLGLPCKFIEGKPDLEDMQ